MISTFPNYNEIRCAQHNNPIQRICLNDKCEDRILCLLCETHLHGKQFLSILDKPTESYKRFTQIINEQIDSYILEMKSNEDQLLRQKQNQLLTRYFEQLKERLEIFIDEKMQEVLQMLESQNQKLVEILKNVRVSKDYVHLDQNLFKICFKAYEGQKISKVFENNQTQKSQQVYNKIEEIHSDFTKLMQKSGFNMKIRIPQIRYKTQVLKQKQQQISKAFNSAPENTYTELKKFDYNLLCETDPFDSIISSSLKTSSDQIITVCYDKKLRIHKRNNRINPNFDLLLEKEYSNILTKIHKIGEDLYAIGQSKQLLIEKIEERKKNEWESKNIMKLLGHQERIVDISSYNTRIIGSSSHQGTKIWDLYKQKCQYTFKQNYNPSTLLFLPKINTVSIGYNNHIAKIYSIEKLKTIRKYQLPGLPLVFSQQGLNQNTFYVGGFTSHLGILDVRLNNLAFIFDFQEEALSSLSEMISDQNNVLLGFRNGAVKIFDLKMRKVKTNFKAENTFSHLSKPNGIVVLYQEEQKQIVTVGCNQRKLKLWKIANQKSY